MPDMIVTPGGPRLRSLVHQVKSGHCVRIRQGAYQVVNVEGAIVHELAPEKAALSDTKFGSGWIVYTFWNTTPGNAVSSFRTTWTVPDPPSTSSDQSIYLFNGLQTMVEGDDPATNGLHILQPVLQWGNSLGGGVNSWAIASWFVGGRSQVAHFSPLVPVETGAALTGLMKLIGTVGSVLTYECSFEGFPDTLLRAEMPAPFQCVETLEAYGVLRCTDYPRAEKIALSGIGIQVESGPPALEWTSRNLVTDCVQAIDVLSNSPANGAVEIVSPRRV